MRTRLPVLFVNSACWTCCAITAAVAATEPVPIAAPTRLEIEVLDDLHDGRLDRYTLTEAAAVAGGLSDEFELNRLEPDLQTRWLAALAEAELDEPDLRAADVFRILHARFLTGDYQQECLSPATTLRDGQFNCVTAVILYHDLCQRAGLRVRFLATRTHLFCGLDGEEPVFIETTCPDWFDRLDDAKRLSEKGSDLLEEEEGQTPFQTGANAIHANPRELSVAQLLGKVYYNRGVAELEAGRFHAAIRLLRTAIGLDPDDASSHRNLLAAYNNGALALSDQGDFAAARELLLQGLAWDPGHGPLARNDEHIHQRWSRALCAAGDYRHALLILQQAVARRPEVELFDKGRLAVCGMWLESALSANDWAAIAAATQALRSLPFDRQTLSRYEFAARQAATNHP